MAGHEDTCWRCGVEWAPEQAPPTTLRLVPASAPIRVDDVPDRRIAVALSAGERTASKAARDAERWTNEGGGFSAEVAGLLPAAAKSR